MRGKFILQRNSMKLYMNFSAKTHLKDVKFYRIMIYDDTYYFDKKN